MELTKQLEAEIRKVMDDYWNSYFEGKLDHWANYLVDDYRNIGGTEEEIWDSKKEIIDYTHRVIDQMKGVSEIRNKQTQIIPYDPYIMVHELMDIYIKIEDEWTFYQKFRLSSLIQKTTDGWKVLHQHGSYPDSKTTEGEAFAFDTLKSENVKLQKAINEKTAELVDKNRELEIEAALQRVRTVAMSMSKPDNLLHIAESVFKELQGLGFTELRNAIIQTFVDDKKYFNDYDFSDVTGGWISRIPYTGHPIIEKFVKNIRTNKEAFVETVVSGKEMEEWKEFRKANGEVEDPRLDGITELFYYHYSIGEGDIGISTFSSISAEKLNLLKRFRNVFDLAYQRYTDIEKAEAQTREAQIETALEKVRSRSLAMHKSEELNEVVAVTFEKLKELQIPFTAVGIAVSIEGSKDLNAFVCGENEGDIAITNYRLPYFDNIITRDFNTVLEKQLDFFVGHYTKEEKDAFYTYVIEHTPEFGHLPDHIKRMIFESTSYTVTMLAVNKATFNINDFQGKVLADHEVEIIQRFAKVFDQAYTRFLDLQKAEAQAREAQIELALERVRARTMAMQNSGELQDTSLVLFQQLKELGEPAEQCTIGIIKEFEGVVEISATLHGTKMQQTFRHKIDEPFVMSKMYRGWKNQQRTLVLELKEEELQQYNQYRNELVGTETFPVKLVPGDRRIIHIAYFSKGMLALSTNKPRPAESLQLLERFAIVFEQTYTRFLDLQKAEAQTREAQIEVAVERVRAKSLAMHRSEDLHAVVVALKKELMGLHVQGVSAVTMYLEQDDGSIRGIDLSGMTDGEEEGSAFRMDKIFRLEDTDPDLWIRKIWKGKEKYFVIEVDEADFDRIIKWLYTLDEKEAAIAEKIIKEEGIKKAWLATVTLEKGKLNIDLLQPPTQEIESILIKMGAAFDLAYTRFLDLQKAEAQARAAQIELAMERVRAKTMAMHKSEEVMEVAGTLFDELQKLGFAFGASSILIMDKETGDAEYWIAGFSKEKFPESYQLKYFQHPYHDALLNAWKTGQKSFVYTLSGNEKKSYDEVLFTQTGYKSIPEEEQKLMKGIDSVTFSLAFMKHGALHWGPSLLNEEQTIILQRFARVFEQSYTRFLDLQKAEAQAREAQIEAALEKVRSSSLAMHHSSELEQVAGSLFDRLAELGLSFDGAFIFIFYKATRNISLWIATKHLSAPVKIDLPYDQAVENNKILKDLWNAIENGEHIINRSYTGEVKNEYFRYVAKYNEAKIPESIRKFQIEQESWTTHLVAEKNSMIGFDSWWGNTAKEEDFKILIRFAKVFEQAYTRFVDLKKAEAQTREAQIETALERVRSRSMAMHSSNELKEVITVVIQQFVDLGFDLDLANFNYLFSPNEWIMWLATPSYTYPELLRIPAINHPLFNRPIETVMKGLNFLSDTLTQEEFRTAWQHFYNTSPLNEYDSAERKDYIAGCTGFARSIVFMKQIALTITNFKGVPYTEEQNNILRRFANAFEQTYTRFLDLQKAEAQARESQIQLALERVRARAMAMHQSAELKDVARELRSQLGLLGTEELETCAINLYEESGEFIHALAATRLPDSHDEITESDFLFPKKGITIIEEMLQAYSSGEDECVILNDGVKSAQWMNVLAKAMPDVFDIVAESTGFNKNAAISVWWSCAFFQGGSLIMITMSPPDDSSRSLLKRFALVFGMAYRRFADLKKAEEQTKEAQIELGLERVRARAMAMQNSDELSEMVAILFEELVKLDLILARCIIWIFDNDSLAARMWMANSEDKKIATSYFIKYIDHPYYNSILFGWKEKNKKWIYDLKGDEKKTIDRILLNETELSQLPETVKQGILSSEETFVAGSFNNFGLIEASGPAMPTDEHLDILNRFGKVFDLSYTRFNDLKQAEAQTRESQIELGLERVRARAMAMQKSDELKELIGTVSFELSKLHLDLDRCFIMIFDPETLGVTWWMSNPEEPSNPRRLFVKNHQHRPHLAYLKAWKERHLKWEYILEGKDKKSWDDFLFVETELSLLPEFVINNMKSVSKVHLSASFNNFGCLNVATLEPLSDEHFNIMLRFAKVFDLTYTRFNDLQKAEAQTRQAKIETALEKVRARALAMQQPEELKDVAEVLRHEMGLLGVEELETCSIFIHDEIINRTECWYALKDIGSTEKKLVSDHFPLHLQDTWVGKEMDLFFSSNAKQVSIVMQGANRKEWINYCEEKSTALRGYYGELIPDRTYHLYKFSHGAMGAASAGDISAESWDLLQRAASVFSLAYSRFKDLTQARTDLQKLKEEKQRAESALSELQTTQKQLIQSEKMASLGELTAGIAHEIQNPLNFVNNFSDVSTELVDEMNEEIEKGNLEDAKQIAKDLKQNLEKINHHGKRAGDIVNGMLQHSRSTTNATKEPTDINKLADEYLRLAYHGLRAKDKSFNATMKTDFDENIGNINIIPQDIGRVILNLITNAFYAVAEKSKQGIADYEPTVSVSTIKIDSTIKISVKDNGNGIPESIKEKIFQPFFTTKPTGQGTGLGLSLSYDIVKAHGGELNVETKYTGAKEESVEQQEGESGTTFIIQLPHS